MYKFKLKLDTKTLQYFVVGSAQTTSGNQQYTGNIPIIKLVLITIKYSLFILIAIETSRRKDVSLIR
jgi:hypothetical protein